MSFFNSLGRGFGRSSKKNRSPTRQPQNVAAGSAASSTSSLALSSSSSSAAPQQLQQQQLQQQTHYDHQLQQQSQQKPLFLCQPFVRTALVKGSFKTIVVLPKYIDLYEWLALNVFEIFTNLNQFYGVVSEFCTPRSCPSMNAGPGLDYLWLDTNRKPVRLPASTYIDYVLTWMNNKINDEAIFPTRKGVPLPQNLPAVIRSIYKQMFRVFAHIYHNHFDKIVHFSLEAHWNSFFAHFITFGKEFDLLDQRDLEPLAELIGALDSMKKFS